MANPRVLALAALASIAGVWLARRQFAAPTTTTGEAEAEQDTTAAAPLYQLGQAFEVIMPGASVDEGTAEANVAAFLQMIRKAEGTAGPNGYRTLFGGRLFDSYADHPRIAVSFTNGAGKRLWTSAAGAFQFLAVSPLPDGSGYTRMDTWDRLQRKLGLPDFSPASQDAAAVELIREAGALGDVRAGRFEAAVSKVRKVWASMPGAGYAQPEKSLEALRLAYINAGGHLA